MIPQEQGTTGPRAEWHDVLLRLAGWLSDEDLADARALLAADRLDELARLIADAIAGGLVPYSAEDAARLRRLLSAHGDPSLVDAGVRPRMEPPPCGFAPVPPWGIGPRIVDEVDRAAVEAAAGLRVSRLWRVWRYPPTGLQPPRRIYLAETPADADPAHVAGRIQDALARAGESAPQVEAYTADTALPDYHRAALGEAETLLPTAMNGPEPDRPARGPGTS